MSAVVLFTHMHPQMPIKNLAQFNTIGSIITIFDFMLVNGGLQTNITSIARTGTNALVNTSVPHQLIVGDKVLLADTGEANFNGIKRVESIVDASNYTIKCDNTGLTSVATGTSKLAPAGWTKFLTSGNNAIYQSANLYDGQPLFIQIEDFATNRFRIRSAKNMTALETAEFITPSGWIQKGNSSIFSFVFFADNKTVHMGFDQTYCFSFGYARKINIEDESFTIPSIYSCSNTITTVTTVSLGNVYTLFGVASNFSNGMLPIHAQVNLLSTETVLNTSVLGVTTVLGTPRSTASGGSISTGTSPIELASLQSGCKGTNTRTGKMPLIPVDIWEKVAELGEAFTPNSRVRGMYQAYSRLPSDYVYNQSDLILRTKIEINGVSKNFVLFNCGSSYLLSTQLYINVDSWDD